MKVVEGMKAHKLKKPFKLLTNAASNSQKKVNRMLKAIKHSGRPKKSSAHKKLSQ